MKTSFLIVGHRGASALFPENTIRSIKGAVECGATAVEVDIRATSDGYLVLSHDPTLERTFGLAKRVSDTKLSEMKELRFNGEPVATLEDAVQAVAGRVGLDLDIKVTGYEERIVGVIKERGHFESTMFTSFFPEVIFRINEIAPEANKGLITMGTTKEAILICSEIGSETILPFFGDLDDELINRIKSSELRMIPWTINDPDEAQRLLNEGAEGVITDDPCNLAKLIDRGRHTIKQTRKQPT